MTSSSTKFNNKALVKIQPNSETNEWYVDKRIFGKFFELNGRDTYPGIIDDCIANGSFEQWHSKRKKDGSNLPWTMRTEIMYRDVSMISGLAYPWEPVNGADSVYRQVEGGVHGRQGKQEWKRYQRIQLSTGSGRRGIMQRITLADERTREYRLRFYARGSEAIKQVHVALEDKKGITLAENTTNLTTEWTKYELILNLDKLSAYRYKESPFGEYRLSITGEGVGNLDLDWVSLMSGDAIEGLYNPTTIELLKKYHVTTIRWGGNYASEYNWRDGIGDWLERPVRSNLNWGGLEPNYFGTHEFLRFCELVGAEPQLNAAFSRDLPPEVAADWVEYVNGDASTPMGKLRAEHGHSEPWGVRLWQVGNENYGHYQFGFTNSIDFAERIPSYYQAMKAVDPTITVIMAGEDLGFLDFSETPGQPPLWNKRMFEIAGPEHIDVLDIHTYTRGISDSGLRKDWINENHADPIFYNQVLVCYPTQFDADLSELKKLAKGYGFDPLKIDVGEWNMEPDTEPGWPKAEYETMAHACYVASMFNTFIRHGDSVKYTHQRDNALYYRAYPIDMRPVNPGNETLRFYAEPFLQSDTNWRHLELETVGESFTMPQTWVRIRRMENVKYVDCAAVISDQNDEIILFAVNRDLTQGHVLTVDSDLLDEQMDVSVLLQYADDPFVRFDDWGHRNGYHEIHPELTKNDNGQFELQMPKGSVARLFMKRSEKI